MKSIFLILFVLTASGLVAGEPVFKECAQSDDRALCNSERLKVLEQTINNSIQNSLGYFIEDSLYFKFNISEDGELEVIQSFAIVSNLSLTYAEKALRELSLQFEPIPTSQFYEWGWKVDLPDEFAGFAMFNEARRFPEMEECNSFNEKGKRACFRYVTYLAKEDTKESAADDKAELRLFISKGKVIGIRADKLPLSKTLADKAVLALNEQMDLLTTENSRNRSDDFFVEFEFNVPGDSLKRWEHIQERLKYLSSLGQKQYFLEELLETESRYFVKKRMEGARYFMEQLANAGIDSVGEIRIGEKVYSLDSIRNFKPIKRENKNETLNFALVESVPVFEGCSDFYGNNEALRGCFQNKLLTLVGKNFNFPEKARKNGIQGKVYIQFVIEKDGAFGGIEIVRGAHPLLDLESIRIISEMPDTEKPAMQEGEPVRMSFTLPINARLQ